MFKKSIVSIGLVVMLALSQVACGGPLSRLDDVLPYVPAVIDFAVNQGRISSDLGAKLKDDVSSGQTIVADTKKCLDDNVKTDAQCYLDMGGAWRVVIGRNHVAQANDPKITVIFNIVSEIVDLVVKKNTQPVGVRGGVQDYDKQIELKIKQLEREVKQ